MRALSSCAWHKAAKTKRRDHADIHQETKSHIYLSRLLAAQFENGDGIGRHRPGELSAEAGHVRRHGLDLLPRETASLRWLFLPGGLNYGIKCRLGFAVTIEQQRIVGAAADGKIVLPRIAIGDAPEGDARHNVGVLDEDGEEVCVALGKGLLDIPGQAVDVGVGAACGRGRNVRGVAASGAREHVDIELADADLHAQGGEGVDRVFLLLEGGPIEGVVALQAHGRHIHSGSLAAS